MGLVIELDMVVFCLKGVVGILCVRLVGFVFIIIWK